MKRMLALFLAVLLLTGCTAKTAKREPDKEREPETIAVPDAKVGSSPEAPEPAEPILQEQPRFPSQIKPRKRLSVIPLLPISTPPRQLLRSKHPNQPNSLFRKLLLPRTLNQFQKQRHRNHPAYTLEVLTRINTTIRVAASRRKSSQRMKSGLIVQKMLKAPGIPLVEAAALNNIIAQCLHPKIEKRKIRWTL